MGELVVWVLKSCFGVSKYELGHWARSECLAWEDDDGDSMSQLEAKGEFWPSFTWGPLPCSKG